MTVDPDDLDGLATFFARRFADGDERVALARAAGLWAGAATDPATAAWRAMVQDAARRGRLALLARRAAERRFADENLRELAAALEQLQPRAPRWVVGVALGLLALGGGVVVVMEGQDDAAEGAAPLGSPAAPGGGPSAASGRLTGAGGPGEDATAQGAGAGDAPAVAGAPGAVTTASEAGTGGEGTPAPTAGPGDPAAAPDPPQGAAAAGAPVPGRCGGTRGEALGWWYGGESFTARAGEVYTIRAGANVREDLPRLENGWSARARIRCSLVPGDRVRLSADPVLVEGGSYWVPMQVGDLEGG